MVGLAGLGQAQRRGLSRLPPRMASLVLDELDDPESLEVIAPLLLEPDPAAAVARRISEEVDDIVSEAAAGLEAWVEESGLGRKKRHGFKKALSRVKKVVHKVREVHKRVQKKLKRYLPIILTVAGIVLAPFTGGLSIAASAVIIAGRQAYEKRKAAKKAREMGKREAAAMEAEVSREEADVARQADEVYNQARPYFEAAGITPERWAAMSLDEKIATIERVSAGGMPVSPEVAHGVQSGEIAPLTTPPGAAEIVRGPAPQPPVRYVAPEPFAPKYEAPAVAPRAGIAPPPGPEEAPPEGEEETAEGEEPAPEEGAPPEAPEAPKGTYELFVEGKEVARSGDVREVADAVGEKAKPGDRFEVFLNGQSLGLKVRVPQGAVSIPPEEEAKVRAMTHGEVQSMVAHAASKAEEEARGGIPLWLLAVPAAAFAVLS